MKNQNNRLDQLFAQAKNQQPVASFNETKKRLLPALTTGLVAGILIKWGGISTKFKFTLMISTLSAISAATIIIATTVNTSQTERGPMNQSLSSAVNLDIIASEGITETVFYDENNAIIGRQIDSSLKKELDEFIALPLRSVEEIQVPETTLSRAEAEKSPRRQGVAAKAQDSVVYILTSKTTKAELDEIQKIAIQAGMDFSYSAKIRSSKISKLKLKISLENEGEKASHSTLSVNGSSFTYSFGWVTGSDGKAVKLLRTSVKSEKVINCTISDDHAD